MMMRIPLLQNNKQALAGEIFRRVKVKMKAKMKRDQKRGILREDLERGHHLKANKGPREAEVEVKKEIEKIEKQIEEDKVRRMKVTMIHSIHNKAVAINSKI
jgi:hypothetical protein